MQKEISNKLPIISFIFGSMAFAFLYGIATVEFELFPFSILKSAKEAATTLQQGERIPDNLHINERAYPEGGVTTFSKDRAYKGYTLLTTYTGESCTNILVDMDGNVVQEWDVEYSQVWGKKAPFLKEQLGDEWTCWHGTHLLPNGHLVATFQDVGTPYCGGLVKLDLESNVVWSLPKCTHHDVHLADDGNFYVPSMYFIDDESENSIFRISEPGRDYSRPVRQYYWSTPIYNETILTVSPEGEVKEEIYLLDAFSNSDFRGIFSINFNSNLQLESYGSGPFDPLHVNDVEIIKEEWARHHSNINAGDMLISLRNISSLAILDKETKLVKWILNGPFIRQHDPDLLSNGNIVIFDNLGHSEYSEGKSRILEIDPKSQEIVWEYHGTSERPFYSRIRGSQQPLPNGNILVTEATGGRVFEVNRNQEIVWEYVNKLAHKGENAVGEVIRAQRFSPDTLTFID